MEKCAVPVEGGEVVQFPTPVTLKLIDTVLVGLGGPPEGEVPRLSDQPRG